MIVNSMSHELNLLILPTPDSSFLARGENDASCPLSLPLNISNVDLSYLYLVTM